MADGLRIKFEDKEVEQMLNKLLIKVKNSRPIIDTCARYVNAVTFKMFKGRRPDNGTVRGVSWDKLAPSTIEQKAALKKRGKAIEIHRPLVRTGRFRDSLRILRKSNKGFTYGTDVKNKGFPYPGFHQVGNGKVPARLWLFLNREDLSNMIKIAIDHINGKIAALNKYNGK